MQQALQAWCCGEWQQAAQQPCAAPKQHCAHFVTLNSLLLTDGNQGAQSTTGSVYAGTVEAVLLHLFSKPQAPLMRVREPGSAELARAHACRHTRTITAT